jgi:hypothetical protein
MRRLTLLLLLAAGLAACAEAPARQAPETAPAAAGNAPSVSVGGTMRGLYGYTPR